MALYLVSYDIGDKDKFEYGPLWAMLRSLNAQRIMYSEWLVTSEYGTAQQIYDKIAPLTLVSDRLLVQEVTQNASWDKLLISDDTFRSIVRRWARN